MSRCGAPLAALYLLVGLTASESSPAYVLSGDFAQPVTSSSLSWVTAEGGARPEHSVTGGHNMTVELKVCRAAQRGGGHFHAGYLDRNVCRSVSDRVAGFIVMAT